MSLMCWWACLDSNQEPDRYERPALTIELQARASVAGCDARRCGTPYNGAWPRAMAPFRARKRPVRIAVSAAENRTIGTCTRDATCGGGGSVLQQGRKTQIIAPAGWRIPGQEPQLKNREARENDHGAEQCRE